MSKFRAAITGIGGYVPECILDNEELSHMVDTSDEWIMQRVGIKERRILKEKGKATSDMGLMAVNDMLEKTNTKPEEIDLLICATDPANMPYPATANLISYKAGLTNAFSYDIAAACSGFLFALETARRFVESGTYKKVIVIGADMMSTITDYTDRKTCPLFGDGAGAVLLECTTEEVGIIDSILGVDGAGFKYLHCKAGGSLKHHSHETIEAKEHFVYQEGQAVFKIAVSKMADISVDIMRRNNLKPENLSWLLTHPANLRN